MADPIPSTQEKKYIEYSDNSGWNTKENRDYNLKILNQLADAHGGAGKISEIHSGGGNSSLGDSVGWYRNNDWGKYSINDLKAAFSGNAAKAALLGMGKAYSAEDYVKRYSGSSPDFDPNDTATISAIAKDIESRGLDPQKNADEIKSFITQSTVNNRIDRATNPGKYLNQTQKDANTATAQRLLQQTYGEDFSNPDLQQFLSERLAEGESPFEVAEFLKTTPDYQKKQADIENERVKTESAGAREALNHELLKSQEEVFRRAQPSIIGSYMRAGRLNSSGLQSALAQAQGELEKERQGFLANAGYQDAIRAQGYGRENFVNNQANAFNSYLRQNEPAYQQKFNVQGASNFNTFQQPYNDLSRQYSLSDQARGRSAELADYDRQQSDFYRYLSSQRVNRGQGALRGAASGAAAGSAAGPWGALIGGIGGGAAGYFA